MLRPLYAIFRGFIYYKYISCNNLSEDGMQRPKHVGGSSESNKYLWLHTRLIGIKTVYSHDIFYQGTLLVTVFHTKLWAVIVILNALE